MCTGAHWRAAHLAAPRRAATEDDDLFTYVGGEGAGGDVQEVEEEFGCEKVEVDGSRADEDRGVPQDCPKSHLYDQPRCRRLQLVGTVVGMVAHLSEVG